MHRPQRLGLAGLAAVSLMLGSAEASEAQPALAQAQGGASTTAPPAKPPADPTPSADTAETRLKLAERILDDMGGVSNLKAMVNSVASSLLSSMTADQQFPPETLKALQDSMSETLTDIAPRLIEDVAKLYAQNFDERQLADIAAFYEGPTGKAMVAKLPQIGQQSALIGASLVPQMQTDMLRRFCQKIDCNQDQMKRFRPQIG